MIDESDFFIAVAFYFFGHDGVSSLKVFLENFVQLGAFGILAVLALGKDSFS